MAPQCPHADPRNAASPRYRRARFHGLWARTSDLRLVEARRGYLTLPSKSHEKRRSSGKAVGSVGVRMVTFGAVPYGPGGVRYGVRRRARINGARSAPAG